MMIITIKNKTVFLHNEDMSGKVKVSRNEYDTLEEVEVPFEEVEVPFEDLEAFVIEHSKKIKRWKEDSAKLSWNNEMRWF